MKKSISLLGIILLFATGCATARLSSGPSLMLTHHQQALNVGVGKVIDKRESATVGTIGAAGIRVKQADFSNLVTNYVVQTLNSQLNVNVTPIASVDSANAASMAKSSNADRVIGIEVKKLKMFSSDAIMQPVQVDLQLQLTVYDKNGTSIYSTPILGAYEKRIGISIVDKSTGELTESVVKAAMDYLVRDQGLKNALTAA